MIAYLILYRINWYNLLSDANASVHQFPEEKKTFPQMGMGLPKTYFCLVCLMIGPITTIWTWNLSSGYAAQKSSNILSTHRVGLQHTLDRLRGVVVFLCILPPDCLRRTRCSVAGKQKAKATRTNRPAIGENASVNG